LGGVRHRVCGIRGMRAESASCRLDRKPPANLLVVFLLVELYKPGGARSRKILCSAGGKNPQAAESPRVQPGRHDLLRFLCKALAADRGWETDHCHYSPQNLPSIPCARRSSGAGSGQGNLLIPRQSPREPRTSGKTEIAAREFWASLQRPAG